MNTLKQVKISPKEIEALREIVAEIEAIIGTGEDDSDREKWAKLAARFFERNDL